MLCKFRDWCDSCLKIILDELASNYFIVNLSHRYGRGNSIQKLVIDERNYLSTQHISSSFYHYAYALSSSPPVIRAIAISHLIIIILVYVMQDVRCIKKNKSHSRFRLVSRIDMEQFKCWLLCNFCCSWLTLWLSVHVYLVLLLLLLIRAISICLLLLLLIIILVYAM